jgi:hypothetical protein
VALCCCLIPQIGPGQLPTIENRSPITLGAPQEPKNEPQVLEFAPVEPPAPNTIVFEAVPPPKLQVVEFAPIATPKPKSVGNGEVPMEKRPEVPLPPREFDPLLPPTMIPDVPSAEKPLQRPAFGTAVGIDIKPPVEFSPRERPPATLVYSTNDPIQIVPAPKPALASTAVRLEAPETTVPMDKEVPPVPEFTGRHYINLWELEAAERARKAVDVRRYMDRLGSPDGTPRLQPLYPQYFPLRYEMPTPRRIDGVMHRAVNSGSRVRESLLWPLRMLAEPFREFD